MHIILSPAKSLDYETPAPAQPKTNIRFPKQAQQIVDKLRKMKPDELMSLMKISAPLAQLNHHRFQLWSYPFDAAAIKAALFAFKGDVYAGLDAYSLNDTAIDYAHKKLRILSGLYGLLRPLDGILPYRLEMGTRLAVGNQKHLYDLWGDTIARQLEADMEEQGSEVLVNLASNEYFKAINPKAFSKRIVTPVFKDWKNDGYKVVSFYAKKARGLMTRFIIEHQLTQPNDLLAFNEEGYYFKADLSDDKQLVFVRDK
ncbi:MULTISPECIES: peroxide stress protein YaaA [unclassified Carboxylicivirga]|uniref:peroxide stress protein YaaA n=1 Tax=Carboxylicivirga TaxID=1628153 RepID=UPI003D331258